MLKSKSVWIWTGALFAVLQITHAMGPSRQPRETLWFRPAPPVAPAKPVSTPWYCQIYGRDSFQSCYFNSINFKNRKVTRREMSISHSWGNQSPDIKKISADRFSATYRGSFDFSAGDYEFSATSDDGVRVYVDNVLVINRWVDQEISTETVTRTMTAGRHKILVEYYENTGEATLHFSWNRVVNPPTTPPTTPPPTTPPTVPPTTPPPTTPPGPGPSDCNTCQPPNGPPDNIDGEPIAQYIKRVLKDANPGMISNCEGRPLANDFLIATVNELRKFDSRWGYFKKPDGRIPRDILAYAWSNEREGSPNTYVVDFVSAGCNNTPGPDFAIPAPNADVWFEVTNKESGYADNGVWSATHTF